MHLINWNYLVLFKSDYIQPDNYIYDIYSQELPNMNFHNMMCLVQQKKIP